MIWVGNWNSPGRNSQADGHSNGIEHKFRPSHILETNIQDGGWQNGRSWCCWVL